MRRRTFLMGTAVVGLGAWGLQGCGQEPTETRNQQALAELEVGPDGLERLASNLQGGTFVAPRCRAALGLSQRQLSDRLLNKLETTNQQDLGSAVRHVIAADYANSELIDIEGWHFARAECMLLALASYHQGLTEAAFYERSVFCEVDRWGPNTTGVGQPFNQQESGDSAFWVRTGCVPEGAVLMLDGTPLPTTVHSGGLVTARVPHWADLSAGRYALTLHDAVSGERLMVGRFHVR